MSLKESLNLELESEPTEFRGIEVREVCGEKIEYIFDEFWTAKQRQAKAIHEVSYRACFKAQLPEYFIKRFSKSKDIIYDPFAGRGTTAIQAGLMGRNVIQNDINPLSQVLTEPRLYIPSIEEIRSRLENIVFNKKLSSDLDLSMFFEKNTLVEILSFRDYFIRRRKNGEFDPVDKWIAMVATNRLTGHSSGFFSVYTFPPNIAVSPQAQIRINLKRNQVPTYRDTKSIILKKSKSLQSMISTEEVNSLREASKTAKFLSNLADQTSEIESNSVQLTVTSPPFLDIVQYADDNWMRCWFNEIDAVEIGKKITMSKTTQEWCENMNGVIEEIYRVTQVGGYLAFEVGEIRNQTVNLDELVIPLGKQAGFEIEKVLINTQDFTKTSNLWGVANNSKGTNTNRIVLMRKHS